MAHVVMAYVAMATSRTPYSQCSKTCGGGVKKRRRKIKVKARYGGHGCPKQGQKLKCNGQKCPIDCTVRRCLRPS